MKIFKKLNKLGYIHYSATTIEELDDLPLNSAERISEQALVLRWFREKHNIKPCFDWHPTEEYRYCIYYSVNTYFQKCDFETYEEAELACLDKLIEIVKNLK